jgi:PAS domain S-box-containing protein
VSGVALRLAFRYSHLPRETWTWRKIGSAILMGAAIPGLHYTGIAAARFVSAPAVPVAGPAVSPTALGTLAITLTSVTVLAVAIGAAELARYYEDQTRAAAAHLADRERQLTEAQALAHVGNWEMDGATNSVTWSDELYRICGLPPGAPAGYAEFLALVHPDERAALERLTREGLAKQRPVEFEWRLVRPSGEVRHVLSRNVVVTDGTGRTVRAIGTCLDITDRKHAELEVKTLRGILPICASCKRIRTDTGSWQQVEAYVRDRTEAEFSHGLCPTCAAKWDEPDPEGGR